MKAIVYICFFLWMFTSCADQYRIAGNSSVPVLDGRMLYLKVVGSDQIACIDSCEVIHGKFNFMGMVDSTVMAELYMDDESVMPIVIENGNLTIRIDNTQQRVTGGSLNDKLYRFIEKRTRLQNEMMELSHKEARMILDGIESDAVRSRLNNESEELSRKLDLLETSFIIDNYDNVLGPGVFMLLCSRFRYPVITEQIERIMSGATANFKRNPFVRDYIHTARVNMERMQRIRFGRVIPLP